MCVENSDVNGFGFVGAKVRNLCRVRPAIFNSSENCFVRACGSRCGFLLGRVSKDGTRFIRSGRSGSQGNILHKLRVRFGRPRTGLIHMVGNRI